MNIVVTGSSSGIGRALTERLLGRGDRVAGIARSDQGDLGQAFHDRFLGIRCDVTDWPSMDRAASEIGRSLGLVDGLVCCAGTLGEVGRAVLADPVKWNATVQANLGGTFHAIRALHPCLVKAKRRPKIVCFSGGGATKARSHFSAYGAAKTAVVRLVENIACEEKAFLDINAIAPGAINTRMTEEVLQAGPGVVGEAEYQIAIKQKESGGSSLGRVIGLVEWLLSDQSDGISGRLLSAPWDPWEQLGSRAEELDSTDIYMLRRVLPEERGKKF